MSDTAGWAGPKGTMKAGRGYGNAKPLEPLPVFVPVILTQQLRVEIYMFNLGIKRARQAYYEEKKAVEEVEAVL